MTKLEFATKEKLYAYVESRQAVGVNRYGQAAFAGAVVFPPNTDDLLRHVSYATAERPDGTWVLVF